MVKRAAAVLLAGLAGCGGGGGGGGESPVVSSTGNRLAGTVAIGAPVGGATVEIRCVGGSVSVTADAAGNYAADLPAGLQAPCMAASRSPKGPLHAVAVRPSGLVNLTPLTQLLVASLLARLPSDAFASWDAAVVSRIQQQGISSAQGHVRQELLKLGVATPDADWIGQPFTARPADAMDGALELLARKLAEHNKTLDGASLEIALGTLYPTRPAGGSPACVPGLISGFSGPLRDDLVKVTRPATDGANGPGDGSGDAPGGAGDGSAGVGIGGSLGQFVDVDVTVQVADGPVFGPVRTDVAKGMVTFVPCDFQPPIRVRLEGREGSSAAYYDEERRTLVSFVGSSIEGIVTRLDRNAGVSPFTEAIVRRVEALEPARTARGGHPLKAVSPKAGWTDLGRFQIAHDEVLRAVNDRLPGNFRLQDLTRLPVALNAELDRPGSGALADTPNGLYGAVIGGFARGSFGDAVLGSPSPALAKARMFARDLSDGVLDLREGGRSLIETPAEMAYDPDRGWITQSVATGRITRDSGTQPIANRQAIVGLSSSHDLFAGARTAYFSSTGRLTFADRCDANSRPYPPSPPNDPGFCFREVQEIGSFHDVDVLPGLGLGALTVDRSVLALYDPAYDPSRPPGGAIQPLARLTVPVAGARYSAFRNGILQLSDGSLWQVVSTGPSGAPAVALTRLDVPPSVRQGVIAHMPGAQVLSADQAQQGYGIAADGSVLVWSLSNPSNARTLPLPDAALQISSNHQQVIARLRDGRVFWLNPEQASRWSTVDGRSARRAIHPAGQPPLPVEGLADVCWIASPVAIDCAGRATALDYTVNGPPNIRFNDGFDVVSGVRQIPGGPFWRAVPGRQFASGVWVGTYSPAVLLAIDGSVRDDRGAQVEVPAAAVR